jgi:hypothetical protein
LSVSGTYPVTAFASYSPNSNLAQVFTNNNGFVASISWNPSLGGGGTQTVDFWPVGVQEQFNIGIFAMHALAFNPGTTSSTYNFNAFNTTGCGGGPGSCYWGGQIHIVGGGGFDKFLVGHEHGHAFFHKNTSVTWPALDFSVNIGPAPCNDGGSASHDIESMELSTSIVHEATASFYAAAAFNNTAQTDCAFYHPQYSNGIDCEFGQSSPDYDIPTAYMKNRCSTPHAGKGVEFDWLRQLWDVRTDPISPPSMNTMLSWINAISSGWTSTNGYQKLDAAADSVGGQLNTNWDNQKVTNGVNF